MNSKGNLKIDKLNSSITTLMEAPKLFKVVLKGKDEP